MVRLKDQLLRAKGRPSAFESAPISKKRHNVIGDRNPNGKARSQLQARSRSDQIRRETLLVEHKQRGRTNTFYDGRFGEADESMPEEDKLVHRFQRERQRQIRTSKYSLSDEAAASGGLGRPTELTHGGQALGDMDELSDADFGFSDDEPTRGRNGFEEAEFVKAAHFGGGGDNSDRQLSSKELLEQTIAKYKMAKYERQEERSEQNKQLQQLDADFDAIRGLVFQAGNQKLHRPASDVEQSAGPAGGKVARTGPAAHGDYEKLAAELKTEMKAKPTDRLQTESELAAAEAERLRHLELERQRRMQPDGQGASGQMRRPTDDDLLDDFGPLPGDIPDDDVEEEEEEEDVNDKNDDEVEEEEEKESEEEEEEEEQQESEEEEEEEEEEESAEEVDEKNEHRRLHAGARGESAARADDAKVARRGGTDSAGSLSLKTDPVAGRPAEMPYVFKCPKSAEELEAVMAIAGRDASRQKELLHRLIAGHNVRLHESNKGKLTTLVYLLINRLMLLADEAAMQSIGPARASANDGPSQLLHVLPPAIFSIAQQLPVPCALAIIDQLHKVWTAWRKAKRSRAQAGSSGSSKRSGTCASHVALDPPALALLALCVQLYPLTDFRHVVLTPCTLLAAEVLAQKQRPTTGVALRRTLFLSSCTLHVVAAAGRWLPELHLATHRLLSDALSDPTVLSSANPPGVKEPKALTFGSLGVPAVGERTEADEAVLRIDAVAATYRLTRDMVRSCSSLPAFVEAFSPTLKLLSQVATGCICPALQAEHKTCMEELRIALVQASGARVPLRLQRAAPVPLRQFNPAFDDDFQPDKSMDPDRERAERQKLVRKTKKERKGAIRELRKDAAFLAVEKEKERQERDNYLEKRGKRALALLEEQEHAVKTMKKEKRKLSRG